MLGSNVLMNIVVWVKDSQLVNASSMSPLMERAAALAYAISALYDEDERESAKKIEQRLFDEATIHPIMKMDWY